MADIDIHPTTDTRDWEALIAERDRLKAEADRLWSLVGRLVGGTEDV